MGNAYKIKANAHRISGGIKIKIGELCQHCGKQKKLTRHHEDYTKPLEVLILCHPCHGKADKARRIRIWLAFEAHMRLKYIKEGMPRKCISVIKISKGRQWRTFRRSYLRAN